MKVKCMKEKHVSPNHTAAFVLMEPTASLQRRRTELAGICTPRRGPVHRCWMLAMQGAPPLPHTTSDAATRAAVVEDVLLLGRAAAGHHRIGPQQHYGPVRAGPQHAVKPLSPLRAASSQVRSPAKVIKEHLARPIMEIQVQRSTS